jgi:hypothetical protein
MYPDTKHHPWGNYLASLVMAVHTCLFVCLFVYLCIYLWFYAAPQTIQQHQMVEKLVNNESRDCGTK